MFRQFYLDLKISTKTSHWSPPMGKFGTIGWDQWDMNKARLSQVAKPYHGAFLDFHFKKSVKCKLTMHLMFTKFDEINSFL